MTSDTSTKYLKSFASISSHQRECQLGDLRHRRFCSCSSTFFSPTVWRCLNKKKKPEITRLIVLLEKSETERKRRWLAIRRQHWGWESVPPGRLRGRRWKHGGWSFPLPVDCRGRGPRASAPAACPSTSGTQSCVPGPSRRGRTPRSCTRDECPSTLPKITAPFQEASHSFNLNY